MDRRFQPPELDRGDMRDRKSENSVRNFEFSKLWNYQPSRVIGGGVSILVYWEFIYFYSVNIRSIYYLKNEFL